jgi:putative oxidoreductase
MRTVIGRYTPQAFAILRIIAGLLFLSHGSQKLLGWPPRQGAGAPAFTSLPGIAGVIELVCGALIVIGLFTGLAAFIASGEMAVAYWHAHAHPPASHPLINHGELAVLYCFLWLYVAAHGAGIWSIDHLLMKRRPIS